MYILNNVLSNILIRIDIDVNKDLVLFVKRKHFISSRVLSEDRDKILRFAKIIDVEVTILSDVSLL